MPEQSINTSCESPPTCMPLNHDPLQQSTIASASSSSPSRQSSLASDHGFSASDASGLSPELSDSRSPEVRTISVLSNSKQSSNCHDFGDETASTLSLSRDAPNMPLGQPKDSELGPPRDSSTTTRLSMGSILNPAVPPDTLSEAPAALETSVSRSTNSSSSISSVGSATPNRSLPSLHLAFPSSPYPDRPASSDTRSSSFATGVPAATIDARKTPFLSSLTTDSSLRPDHGSSYPGSGLTAPRSLYTVPMSNEHRLDHRRNSDARSVHSVSPADSPSTNYSTFGPGSRQSPGPLFSSANASAPAPGSQSNRRMSGGLMLESGSTAQTLLLSTEHGTYPVQCDVQTASRVADEKRQRNAGASARFRARRKEKERESATLIGRLESDLHRLGAERERYRMERDYFRSMLESTHHHHDHTRLPPPSPTTSPGSSARPDGVQNPTRSSPGYASPPRGSSRSLSGYSSPPRVSLSRNAASPHPQAKISPRASQPPSPDWQQDGVRGSEEGRHVRRRLSGYFDQRPGHDSSASSSVPPLPPLLAKLPQQPSGYSYTSSDGSKDPPRSSMSSPTSTSHTGPSWSRPPS